MCGQDDHPPYEQGMEQTMRGSAQADLARLMKALGTDDVDAAVARVEALWGAATLIHAEQRCPAWVCQLLAARPTEEPQR